MLHAVIMAGGTGTRFWPASRAQLPKQLLPLASDRTMMQATVDRLQGLIPSDQTLIVTNEALVAPMREQLPQLPAEAFLGEPCKRDTAPCIGLAAAILLRRDPQATMLVLPADHVIEPIENFQKAVQTAERLVAADPSRIVTFGVRPSYPAESFGYIERAESIEPDAYRVRVFREKPNRETAERYLATGNFFWNSGIFVWRAKVIDDALARFEPDMHARLQTIADALGRPDFAGIFEREFAAIKGKSIDYAVMERSENVVVVEAPFSWDDVGSWQALGRLRGTDPNGNTVIGEHLGLDTKGCIIRGEGNHLIATLGMKDCIIVHTDNVTLVARKHDEESVRKIVDLLKQRGHDRYL